MKQSNKTYMQKKYLLFIGILIVAMVIVISVGIFACTYFTTQKNQQKNNVSAGQSIGVRDFVGPRSNIEAGTPTQSGFNTFSVVVLGVISRSGQPTLSEFQWLKNNGWKGVVDLRTAGEYNEIANDRDIKGFSDLGFNYLWLQIPDGSFPTDDQAKQFIAFVTNPANQPVQVHCRAGVGRTGVMIALYRYQIQAWTMDQAIFESRLYNGGVNSSQAAWLNHWAADNPH
jgi:protein-tyrosine phosphatase